MQLPNYQPGDCHVREWFKTEMGRENEKTAILAALIDHLSSVLQDSSSFAGLKKQEYPYPREGHLQSLLQTWEDVKIDIADTLDSEDTERIEARLEHVGGIPAWRSGSRILDLRKVHPQQAEGHAQTLRG